MHVRARAQILCRRVRVRPVCALLVFCLALECVCACVGFLLALECVCLCMLVCS